MSLSRAQCLEYPGTIIWNIWSWVQILWGTFVPTHNMLIAEPFTLQILNLLFKTEL